MKTRFSNIFFRIIIILFLLNLTFSQIKRDPRMIGMGKAYSTVVTDYRCVGINPANLAFNQSLKLNIFGGNFHFSNNMFSIETYNKINGSSLYDVSAEKYFEKNDIFTLSKKQGFRINYNSHIPVPMMNISKGIFAFTSDFVFISDVGIPEAYLDLIFNGISASGENSDIGKKFNFDFKEDILAVNEFAFSMGIPYDNFGIGVSLKYLQGLFYIGIDQDSSYATLMVDSTEVVGEGRILLRQAIGGGGLGLDLGLATKRSDNGWKFGFSFINLFSKIQWNKPNITRNLFGEFIESYMPYRQNEYFLFEYIVEDVSASSFMGSDSDMDSLFRTWSYPVVEHPDSGLINSENKSDEYLKEINLTNFSTDYPSFFILGFSKEIPNQAIIAMDMKTGFSNSLASYNNWRFSFGTEITRFKRALLRLGYEFGSRYGSNFSYGLGYSIGPINADLGITFNRGLLVNTSKGIDLSFGLIWKGN